MKKFSLLIALTLMAGCIALSPSTANAQDEKQDEFVRIWYDTCYTKKDNEKCYQLSKELIEKYPSNSYRKNAEAKVKQYEQGKAWDKFQAALKTYYTPPQDPAKLDQLFAASEDYLKIEPSQQTVVGHMAMAGAKGAMGEVYKNLDKVKGYVETALKAFAPAAPPEGWKKEEWEPLRELVLAQMNQYLGWHLIMGTKGDQNQGLDYLTKAVQVRGKDGDGWKDPNNYYLRSAVYSNQYAEFRKSYDAMPDDQKSGDAGKEILKKINELLDTKLIPEYARILATATKPETKGLYDFAKPEFDKLWEFRTGAKDKAADYIKNYLADPTIASVPIPAKPEDTGALTAPTPTTGAANVKLSTGGSGIAPGGKNAANGSGKGAASGNGPKSTPAKGKGAKSSSKAKRKRG